MEKSIIEKLDEMIASGVQIDSWAKPGMVGTFSFPKLFVRVYLNYQVKKGPGKGSVRTVIRYRCVN